MEVTVRESFDLKPVELPFEVWMKFNRKSNVKHDYWFTPTGKCNFWVGGLHLNHLGNISKEQYNELMSMMKKTKCDLLTDGTYIYTTSDVVLIRINNGMEVLNQAKDEFEERKIGEGWKVKTVKS
jgi:hypothetical protein